LMGEWRQSRWSEPLIYEYSKPGKKGIILNDDFSEYTIELPEAYKRQANLALPEVSEVEVARHFTRLSQMSYGVDLGPVPLGSCTMKYNPKLNEDIGWDKRITWLHPLQDDSEIQGILETLYELQNMLAYITGMDSCTLSIPAGASGEFAGALIIRKYLEERGEHERSEIIVPDSAHGTNPASARMAGFEAITVHSNKEGTVDIEELRSIVGPRTAGIMLTNPNTLGLFEKDILTISKLVHENGGLLYYDGANLNGIMGITRPGDMGFDIVHLNLHKTFSAPHGGGGPGGAALCVKEKLAKYLPRPLVIEKNGEYRVEWSCRDCVGYMHSFMGNVPVALKAYAYIKALGGEGLRKAAIVSVLNTNYFKAKIGKHSGYSIPYNPATPRKHEIVLSAKPLKEKHGITALDIAKYLLDNGVYAPTIYFPLIVEEALMIEFTETETKENIDKYIEILEKAAKLAEADPRRLKEAPINTSVRRIKLAEANMPKNITPTYRVLREKEKGNPLYRKL